MLSVPKRLRYSVQFDPQACCYSAAGVRNAAACGELCVAALWSFVQCARALPPLPDRPGVRHRRGRAGATSPSPAQKLRYWVLRWIAPLPQPALLSRSKWQLLGLEFQQLNVEKVADSKTDIAVGVYFRHQRRAVVDPEETLKQRESGRSTTSISGAPTTRSQGRTTLIGARVSVEYHFSQRRVRSYSACPPRHVLGPTRGVNSSIPIHGSTPR